MLAERGIDVSYQTVRRWALKFDTIIARKLRRGRSRPDGRWHLDEVFVDAAIMDAITPFSETDRAGDTQSGNTPLVNREGYGLMRSQAASPKEPTDFAAS